MVLVCQQLIHDMLPNAQTFSFRTPESVEKAILNQEPDLLIVDLYLEYETGIKVLSRIADLGFRVPAIIFTAYTGMYYSKCSDLDHLRYKGQIEVISKNEHASVISASLAKFLHFVV